MVQAQLASIPIYKDVIANLPPEIVAIVAPYLELEDFMRVRSVSRNWRAAWEAPAVVLHFSQRYFPVMLRGWKASAARDKCQSRGHASVLVRETAMLLKREYGKYCTMAVYSNSHPRFPCCDTPDYVYNSGRVAYHSKEEARIFVTDLWNNSRRTYTLPQDKGPIGRWELNNNYLIVAGETK